MALTPLASSELFAVSVDGDRGLVLLKRSKTPVRSPEEVAAMFAWIMETVIDVPEQFGCVIDVRDIVGTSDPAIEQATHAPLLKLRARFARNVTLVRSVVGAMHVQRLQRDRDQDSPVTSDETEAMAYAAGELD